MIQTLLQLFGFFALMSLVAVGDKGTAQSLVAALSKRALSDDDQGVAARAGGDFAVALTTSQKRAPSSLPEMARSLASLGGSRAQRDIFMRVLAELAVQDGADTAAQEILTLRGREGDRFARMTEERISTKPIARRVA